METIGCLDEFYALVGTFLQDGISKLTGQELVELYRCCWNIRSNRHETNN